MLQINLSPLPEGVLFSVFSACLYTQSLHNYFVLTFFALISRLKEIKKKKINQPSPTYVAN